MKKTTKVRNETDIVYKTDLECLEGDVIFSELHITPGNWSNLVLKLDSEYKGEIWIRGNHRIDVGEKIRVHYEHYSPDNIVAGAYEILSSDGVKFRYSSFGHVFVDEVV